MTYDTLIYGHRGYSEKYPENTMTAYMKALEYGADGIELDVQETKDGRLVICHDESINRVSNGEGMIRDMTLEELRKFSFNASYPECMDNKIPLFEEVMEEFKDKKTKKGKPFGINVELKTGFLPYPGMEKKTLDMVKYFGMLDRIIFSSFNHETVVSIKNMEPQAKIGFLVGTERLSKLSDYIKSSGGDAYHPNYNLLRDKSEIDNLHSNGIKVNIYTVNMGSKIRQFCDWGVDIIITNRVELGVEIREDKISCA